MILNRLCTFSVRAFVITIAAGLATIVNCSSSTASNSTQFYVSPSGNNTDGLTWKTAWTDFTNVRWNTIPNDYGAVQISVDAGSNTTASINYSPLNVPNSNLPQLVFVATNTKNNPKEAGKIIIDGHKTLAGPGLSAPGSNPGVFVEAGHASAWVIRNFVGDGVKTGSLVLQSAEVSGNTGAGVRITDTSSIYQGALFGCLIHDNGTNVLSEWGGVFVNPPPVDYCWIYNSTYTGADGVHGYTMTADSIIGPGVANCISMTGLPPLGNPGQLSNDLFLNATHANVQGPGFMLGCTSYMTHLNPSGQAHYCLLSTSNEYFPFINNSVFMAGVVNAPTQTTSVNDIQFRTTGNTQVISATETDPGFTDPAVYNFADNVPINTLIKANYASKNSHLTSNSSVSQLLQYINTHFKP